MCLTTDPHRSGPARTVNPCAQIKAPASTSKLQLSSLNSSEAALARLGKVLFSPPVSNDSPDDDECNRHYSNQREDGNVDYMYLLHVHFCGLLDFHS
jgi:hypothetical protein